MNILLIYPKSNVPTLEYFEESLKKIADVEYFDIGKTSYWSDFRNKMQFYIPKGIPVSIQKVLKKINKKIDLIIQVTSFGQYHLTGYKKLRNTNPEIRTVLWASDIYRFDQRKFLLWIKNDFDYVFSTQKNYVDIFKPVKSYWLTYYADHETFKKFNLPKIYDIVFVGNTNPVVYPERVRLLKLIGEKFNLKIFSCIYGKEMAKIYNQAKIVFNKTCAGEINMRVFEALSCESFLLTDRLRPEVGLEELFQDKKHLVLYDTEQDLLEKISYYLRNETEREEIAYNGHKEVLAKHTCDHRAKEMIKIVTENLN